MPRSDYLEGVFFFAAVWGSAAAVASVLYRRRLRNPGRVYGPLAWALLFLGALLLFHLVPGMLGILTRGTVLAAAGLGLLLSLLVGSGAEARSEPYPESAWQD